MFGRMLRSFDDRIVRASDDYGYDAGDEGPDPDLQEPEAPEPDDLDPEIDEGDEPIGALDADTDEADDQPIRAPVRQPTRAQARIQELNRRAQEAERIAQQAQAQLQALAGVQTQQQQAAFIEQRNRQLEALDPDQRLRFEMMENNNLLQHQMRMTQFQMADMADKASFEAYASRNPAAAKLVNEVEQQLQLRRQQGINVPRQDILFHILGQRAAERAPQARGRQEKAAAANRDQQTVRAGATRSDVAGATTRRSSESEARRKRLSGMNI